MAAIHWAIAAALSLATAGGPSPRTPSIGSAVADFELTDFRGGAHRPVGRAVVFVSLRAGCPVAEMYGATLAGLAGEYEPKGVSFVGLAVDGPDAAVEMGRYAEAHRIGFPIARDLDGVASARLGMVRSPAVVVLDEHRAIRYRGRVDDQYAVGSRRPRPGRRDLAEALEDLLAGRAVRVAETEPVGCPIDRPPPLDGPGSPPPPHRVTYARDVAPILRRRCVGCHRPGQIGPFALTDHRQAAARAGAIADAVDAGRMPPWHADPRHGRFANEAVLTAREKSQILEWVEQGAPEGDPAGLAPPPTFADGWAIAEPDLVVSIPRPFDVPARGVVDYQYFEVDPGFREDRWVRAAEIRPGNRKVVHHCNVFLRAPGSRAEVDPQGELGSVCLAATTPGSPPMTFPEGMAKRIPAGWRLLFVVHYAPIGTPQVDRTSLGLVFADPSEVRKEVATNLLLDPDLRIPPHAANHRVERTRRFDDDVLLLAMFPHMHLRGKSFRYEAIYPGGRSEVLLDVPRYDFRWQNRYELAEPRRLPAGTTLRCIATFDNSAANPSNPDPTAVVRAGQQSWDEMFNGYYDIVLADQDLTRPEPWARSLRAAAGRDGWSAWRIAGLACAIPAWWLVRRNSRSLPPRP